MADFNAASIGEPAPFDGFRGADFGPSFSASFTFSYAPGAYTAARLTFGIYDHDSFLEGDQVASFTVDGADLTAELNSIFEASGGQQTEVNVYTIDLSAALA